MFKFTQEKNTINLFQNESSLKETNILHNNNTLYFLMGSHYYNDDDLLHKIFLISTSYWITLFLFTKNISKIWILFPMFFK